MDFDRQGPGIHTPPSLVTPPPQLGEGIPYDQQVEQAAETLPDTLPDDPRKLLIALDVDGTLVTAKGASRNVYRTVNAAIEAGMNVVIATGRGLSATRPVFEELEMPHGYSVSSNGAQIVLWERAADGRHVYQKLKETYFEPRGAAEAILRVVPEAIIATDDGEDRMRVSRLFPQGELLSVQDLHDMEDLLRLPTIRMVARAPQMGRQEFANALATIDLSNVECAVGWTSWADVTARGTTKAQGLAELVTQLGVDQRGTIAIGDGTNDIAMLRWAAHGVAMGGATQEVEQAANATTGAVDHDGAAAVLEALLRRY